MQTCGGGAGEAGNTDGNFHGGDGATSSITGSAVTRAGGGASYTGTGGAGGGGDASTNGTVNTGGGGGSGSGLGGSGVVILKYADTYTITIGAGLTGSTAAPSGGYKVTTITAGTGNVSWS